MPCLTLCCVKFGINVALLTLNRPAKLNALNYELIDHLMELLDRIERDETLRVIILTGAGDHAFSSGADIAGFAPSVRQGQEVALRDFVRRGQRMTVDRPDRIIPQAHHRCRKRPCPRRRSEITEAAPLAIASERAEFCKAEIALGFAPPFGGSQRLPRLIGRKRALRMILTAEPIDAFKAREFGLINHVVPHGMLLGEAFSLAGKIAEKSPLAVKAEPASTVQAKGRSRAETRNPSRTHSAAISAQVLQRSPPGGQLPQQNTVFPR